MANNNESMKDIKSNNIPLQEIVSLQNLNDNFLNNNIINEEEILPDGDNVNNVNENNFIDYFAYDNFQNDNAKMFDQYEPTRNTLKSNFASKSLHNFFRTLYTNNYIQNTEEMEKIGINTNYKPRTRLEWYVYVYRKASEFLNYFMREFDEKSVEEIKIVNVPKQNEMKLINTLNEEYEEETAKLVRKAKSLQSHYSRQILNTLKYLFKNKEYIEMKRNISIGQNEDIDMNFTSFGNSIKMNRIRAFLEIAPTEIARTINKYSNIVARKKNFDMNLMERTRNIFEKIFGTSDLNNLEAVSARYVQLYNMYKYLKRILPKEFKETTQFEDFESDLRDLRTYTMLFMRYKIIIQTPIIIIGEQVRKLEDGENVFGNNILPEGFTEKIELLREIRNMTIE